MATPTIGELLARLEEQQARIDRLEARSTAPVAGPVPGDPVDGEPAAGEAPPAVLTRRGMVRTAAAGAAGVVGAMLVESGGVASAATSGPGTFTSSTSKAAVTATNTGKGEAVTATAQSGTAVHGLHNSAGAQSAGVRGTIVATNGRGVGVVGTSPNGTGVRGLSTSGPGAQGTSGTGTGVEGSSASGTGVQGSSGTGTGVTGSSGSTAANAAAVQGTITSTSPGPYSAGVRGTNNGTLGAGVGVYGSQNGSGYGVYGYAPSGSGVVGQSGDSVGVHGTAASGGYGVLGDTVDGNGYGVSGEADSGTGVNGTTSSGTGVQGSSGSGTGVHGTSSSGYGVYGNSPNNYAVVGLTTGGNGVYGQVSTASQAGVVGRQEDASGNWAVYGFGNIGASGTKSAVVPAADGNGHLTLYCMESPECWFEDFGSARLSGGSASVRIDPEFAQTVDTGDYHVFLQAEGQCKGLIVEGKTATGFAVGEAGGGTSNVSFAYRIVARRKDVTAPRLNRVAIPDAPAHVRADAPAPARPKVPGQGR